MERSLVFIKPDGVQRGLCGEIIKRLELRGLQMIACKFILVTSELAREHYKTHIGKPFYEGLIKYITSSPVLAMVWEGPLRFLQFAKLWERQIQSKQLRDQFDMI